MRRPVDMLHEIPDLAVEVQVTAASGAPNPGARTDSPSRPVPGSRPPLDLAALHATMPDGDADYIGHGLRGELGMCIRLIIEEMAEHETAQIPDYPDDTWAGICGWLTATAHWWQVQSWADDIVSTIRQVHGQLRTLARIMDPPRLQCTRLGCGATATLQDGGRWVLCRNDHHIDVQAERMRFLSMQDWPLAACRRSLLLWQGKDVPQRKLEKWVQRGDLQPVRHTRGKKGKAVALYNFGAVMRRVAEWETRRAAAS